MAAVRASMEPIQPEVLAEPVIASMCTSHIVQDETMGVTYMDMVTTSVGRMALSSSCMKQCSPAPTIEDITNLS